MYKYNERGHCIAKKLPGADWIYYIYDKADRLIFSQDGEQRARSEWRFTIPDLFGRVVLEGICKNSLFYDTDPLQGTVVKASHTGGTNTYKGYTFSYPLTTATVHSAWYYDNYSFCNYNDVPARSSSTTDFKEETRSGYSIVDATKTQGLLTGELHMMLKGTTTTLSTVYYYDNRGRMVQTKHKDHNGKINKEFLSLAFDGLVEKRFLSHRSPTNTEYTEEYLYAYDHARRPTTTTHKWNGASTGVVLEANTYDALGRINSNVPMGITRMQSTHSYDVRSRAEYITRGFFNQHFGYTYGSNIASYQTYLYYGNKKYDFTYDGLGRLTNAAFSLSSSSNFATSYTYDKNGNMATIQRYGRKAYQTYGLIDQITTVRDGNRIVKATDGVANFPDSQSQDFKDYVNKTTEYTYNQNGAMTQDQNRGITLVTYNILNLPEQIDIKSPVAEARNEYYYSSDGVKRRVIRKWNPNYSTSPVIGSAINTSSLTQTETTDYVGNVEYVNNVLKRVYVGAGYIENNVYHCYLKDYLANTRLVATPTDSMYQWLNYYPYGMLYGDRGDQGRQQIKYGGKEFDDKHGLNLYDFGARFYDPALGIFLTPDPLAEKYYSTSPYAYCLNNPMRFVDPTGKWIESAWDIFSLVTGAKNFVENVKQGNVGAAVVDAIGVVVDVAAVALPVVPGGAGAAIKGVRAADKVVDATKAAKTVDKTANATKALNRTTEGTKGARFVGDIDGKVIDLQTTPKGSYIHPDGSRTDVLQTRPHFDKKTQTSHGTSHTHEKYTNTRPDGTVQEGPDLKKTHIPTYEEVERIRNGQAIKTK
ncbi:RHS repeat-associated protein [Parabacteroides sp. PFB2-10]|uniref:RHS repeat-associated core domain-containing protein n=1 Tax=Parabacteroides sp. PFB2-10 TaxID=1742405 RepID=UPI002475FB86|nr:RHS repeat-associated core domain-containing protein [Parabacteroides sp. PFB2-10]MDH6311934.1 RHS repeat-associated protein [Parabacteroides sp. PFB2-10]